MAETAQQKHTTERELAFLDAIVSNRNTEHANKEVGKIKALEGYIRGSEQRRWGAMDGGAIISHAYRLLNNLKFAIA